MRESFGAPVAETGRDGENGLRAAGRESVPMRRVRPPVLSIWPGAADRRASAGVVLLFDRALTHLHARVHGFMGKICMHFVRRFSADALGGALTTRKRWEAH